MRHHQKYQWYINIDHYWNTLVKKPGALEDSQAWHQASDLLKTIYEKHFKDHAKEFIQLCGWCNTQGHSIEHLQQAIIKLKTLKPTQALCIDSLKYMMAQHQNTSSAILADPTQCDDQLQDMSTDIETHCDHQLQHIQNMIY